MTKTIKNVAISQLAGRPRCYKKHVAFERDMDDVLLPYAEPLGRVLVGQQVDGVSLNNGSLLNRQYDEEFGKVDPACDIHTDSHLLQDALMRDYRTSLITKQNNKAITKQDNKAEEN